MSEPIFPGFKNLKKKELLDETKQGEKDGEMAGSDGLTDEEREMANFFLPKFETPTVVVKEEKDGEMAGSDGLTDEEREMANFFLPSFETAAVLNMLENIRLKEKKEGNQEIINLQELFVKFEADHPLDKLNSIIDLKYTDAPNHPVREPARKDLIPILGEINDLKNSIPKDEYDALYAQYKKLSNAVGFINNDKVRHS